MPSQVLQSMGPVLSSLCGTEPLISRSLLGGGNCSLVTYFVHQTDCLPFDLLTLMVIFKVTARDVETLVFETLPFLSLGTHKTDQELSLVHVSGWGCLDSKPVFFNGTRSTCSSWLVPPLPIYLANPLTQKAQFP